MDIVSENFKMTKGQTHSQNQVRDMIQTLNSWRDESHAQMSNIISSYTKSIDLGFNGLVEEFNDLHAQNDILRNERNLLLETVDNLNNEIRQMSAKFTVREHEDERQEEDIFEVDIPDIKAESIESKGIQSETCVEEKCVDSEDICVDHMRKGNPSREQNPLNTTIKSELDGDDKVARDGRVSKEAITFQTLELPFKCEKCPLSYASKSILNRHIRAKHEKVIKYACDDCEYVSFTSQSVLNRHIRAKHDMVRLRNHVCDKCAYAAYRKDDLRRHWNAVHNMGAKKFACKKCPYSSTLKYNLKQHIARHLKSHGSFMKT